MSSTRARTSNAGILGLVAAAVLSRHLLVTETASGADFIDNVADLPKGITLDGVDAIGDTAAIALLGKGDTKILKMAGTGSRGDRICASVDGSGTGRAIPATAGLSVYVVGYADEDWAADQEIAVIDCVPYLHRNPAATIADAAATDTAPVALTYAAPSGGATQDAEARASLAQSAADVAAIRTRQGTVITELVALKTKVNAILAALEDAAINAAA